MALIKTIQELRAVVPRLSNLSNTAGMPNFDMAGLTYIVPLIGRELYNSLDQKYNSADPLTTDEATLVKQIQFPLGAFGLIDNLPFIQTNITDNGIRSTETESMKAAHRWEYKELLNGLQMLAANGMEQLLNYLYAEKEKWPTWENSDQYKRLSGFLIRSGSEFRDQYPILQPLRTYWALQPVMKAVEENYLAAKLGRDLLTWVKDQDEILIDAEGGEVDVKDLLRKATAHLTIKHAGDYMAVQFSLNGFTVLAAGGSADDPLTDAKAPASMAEIQKKTDAANRDGQNFLTKSARYLVGIAAGQYGEDFGGDFTTAFEKSPLNPANNQEPITSGNERRRIFRMP